MDQHTLKALLIYNPDTGEFFHRFKRARRCVMNKPIGSLNQGYLVANINKRIYRLHRLAWLWLYGEMPKTDIDHINGNRSDNRACNLRLATRAENLFNAKRHADNRSGVKGVSWHAGAKKWFGRVHRHGISYGLGFFASLEDARLAVEAKRLELHREFAKHQ